MIAVFGGSFNPPTRAHIKIIDAVLQIEGISRIVLIPLADNYDKADLVVAAHRVEMLKRCFQDNKNVKISSLDIMTQNQLLTAEYMGLIQEIVDEDLAFVCGADNLERMPEWIRGEEVLKKYTIIAIKRGSQSIEKILEKNDFYKNNSSKIVAINQEMLDKKSNEQISSTKVRCLIKENNYDELDKYIIKNTKEYIEQNQLYK